MTAPPLFIQQTPYKSFFCTELRKAGFCKKPVPIPAMNRAKTQLMTNGAKRKVTVDGQDIQFIDEYVYLGQIASFENRQSVEINRCIENAWKSFWSMKALLKGNLPLCLKRKLIDMCILPVLTYGAQTWSLTEAQKSKLKVCQRAMERSILGVRRTDRIRNTELRSKTQL